MLLGQGGENTHTHSIVHREREGGGGGVDGGRCRFSFLSRFNVGVNGRRAWPTPLAFGLTTTLQILFRALHLPTRPRRPESERERETRGSKYTVKKNIPL
jgi:hypothetical protein